MPAVDLALSGVRGALGPDPIAEALNRTGFLALVLLLACLACTPARVLSGSSLPMAARRPLGLLAFAYAASHAAVYLVLDQGLRLGVVVEDVLERPFILAGTAALALLVPLALTSGPRAAARLGGRRWRRLHRLVYAVAVLAVAHFFLRVKKDLTEPLLCAGLLAASFAVRIAHALRRRRAPPPPRPREGPRAALDSG